MYSKIPLVILCLVCSFGCASPSSTTEEPWKLTLRSELEHPQVDYFPYKVDAGLFWFVAPREVGKILETVPKTELITYLESMQSLPSVAKAECDLWLTALQKGTPHGTPIQLRFKDGALRDAVEYSLPMSEFLPMSGGNQQQPAGKQ